MPRHPYPPLDTLPAPLAEALKHRIGPDRGNVWKMLAWSPALAQPFVDFNDAVRYRTVLSPELRELIILRVGHLCEAPYELHHHTRIAREEGMSEELIRAAAVGAEAPGLDDAQQLVLALTDDLVNERRASDATFAPATAMFGAGGLTEIIMLVGSYVLACMFLRSFAIDIEQPPPAASAQ